MNVPTLYIVYRFVPCGEEYEQLIMHVAANNVDHATELFKKHGLLNNENSALFFIQNDYVAEGNFYSSISSAPCMVTKSYFKEWVYMQTYVTAIFCEMK